VEVTAWHHFYVTLNPRTGEVGLEPSHEVEPCLTVSCGRSCGFRIEELHHLADVARVVLPAAEPGRLRCVSF
jgi:hypothetical protein